MWEEALAHIEGLLSIAREHEQIMLGAGQDCNHVTEAIEAAEEFILSDGES